jgi:hypothetical protein
MTAEDEDLKPIHQHAFVPGTVVMIKDKNAAVFPGLRPRHWVVLNVTQEEVDKTGINTDRAGLHGFGGMWYGDEPMDNHSYGKIVTLAYCPTADITVVGHVSNYDLATLKEMVG